MDRWTHSLHRSIQEDVAKLLNKQHTRTLSFIEHEQWFNWPVKQRLDTHINEPIQKQPTVIIIV